MHNDFVVCQSFSNLLMITDRTGGGDICAGWRKNAINFIDAYVLRCNFCTGGTRKNLEKSI